MKKKFVQTVFLSMAAVSMLTIAALAAPPVGVPSAEIGYTRQNSGYAGVGGQLMRLGIYYGSNGKSSVDLTTVVGDGFLLGYYDVNHNFMVQSSTTSLNLTVQVDPVSSNTITVYDRSTGMALYTYSGDGEGLAVEPYSLSGQQTIVKCGYPY